jgi:hypothetical protein
MSTTTLQVRKDKLTHHAPCHHRRRPAGRRPGARARRALRLTSNNITYAAFGDAMSYWQFWPGTGDDPDGTAWGCIPVWGFGTVVQSLHPGVAVGERLYGYWPMASMRCCSRTG